MSENIVDHDHNGLYTRKNECNLIQKGFEKEFENMAHNMEMSEEHMKEDISEVQRLFNKILYILIGGFVLNIGSGVILKLLGS